MDLYTLSWQIIGSHFPHIVFAFSLNLRERLLTGLCWRRGGLGLTMAWLARLPHVGLLTMITARQCPVRFVRRE